MKICWWKNGKIQNYWFFLRKKISSCSKFAAALTINTICYRMQYLEGEKNIYFYFSIFWFTNFLYKFDVSFFPTLHRFSIILANIEGRIKIKDISNSAWPGLLQNTNDLIHRRPQTCTFCTTRSETEIRLHTLYIF